MKNIVIVGQESDPHTIAVSKFLKQKCANIILLDIQKVEKPVINLFFPDIAKDVIIDNILNKDRFFLSDIDAVWWRLKPSGNLSIIKERIALHSEFAQREWRTVLDSLAFFTPEALWINSLVSQTEAKHKPIQLKIAKDLGFNIPETLISNDPSQINLFLENSGSGIIYKMLTYYIENLHTNENSSHKCIFTSRVNKDHIKKGAESILLAPGIFQRELKKKFEVRTTIIGNKIFSARIHSQYLEETKLDWRKDQINVPYYNHELPEKICELLIKMNEKLGIIYGAYDFIVTPDEEYYFLEVNPTGNWLWLEERIDYPVTQALAEYLVS